MELAARKQLSLQIYTDDWHVRYSSARRGKTHSTTLSVLRIVPDIISQIRVAAINQALLSGETIDVMASY